MIVGEVGGTKEEVLAALNGWLDILNLKFQYLIVEDTTAPFPNRQQDRNLYH